MAHEPAAERGAVPAMVLPGDDEAALMADTVPLLIEVRDLVAALGDQGCELGADGNLSDHEQSALAARSGLDAADADQAPPPGAVTLPALRQAVEVALEAGFVRRHRSRLVPVMGRRAMLLDDPDDAWSRLADALLTAGPLALAGYADGSGLGPTLDSAAVELLAQLYRHGPARGAEVADRAGRAARERASAAVADEALAKLRRDVAMQLGALAHGGIIGWQRETGEAGGVALSVDPAGRWLLGAALPDRAPRQRPDAEETLGALDRDGDTSLCHTVALTPLGAGLMHRRLAADGATSS